jgi:hypothetical protein
MASIVGPAHRMASQSLKALAAALKQARDQIADAEDGSHRHRQ